MYNLLLDIITIVLSNNIVYFEENTIFAKKRSMKKKNIEEIYTSEKLTVLSDKKNDSRIVNLTCPIYQTNFLTDAKQILNKGTYRAVKFIVKKIQDERLSVESYINNNETLKLIIPRADILRWYPDEHAHRELKAAAAWLNNTSVNYETPSGWVKAKLVGEVNYDINVGMTIYITPGVLPLYYVVNKHFTMLDFAVTMSIQDKATAFFYDKCCKWRSAGIFTYTPTELAEAINVSPITNLLKTRYILSADREMKKLFQEGLIDFYFDTYELRSGKGRGGKLDKFVFRIQNSLPGSKKDYMQQAQMRTYIIESIKKTVPSLVSDDIFQQLKELSRTELKDLCSELTIFRREVEENVIRDARGILWFKLRNRYNINPNGITRLTKNPQNEYPKYKKISEEILATQSETDSIKTYEMDLSQSSAVDNPEWWKFWKDTISYIIENKKNNGISLTDSEKYTLNYLFNDADKVSPEYNGSCLSIRFDFNIYKNYIIRPFSHLYEGLNELLIQAIIMYFPKVESIEYKYTINEKEETYQVYKH